MALKEFQWFAHDWALERLYIEDFKGAGILADPGLGKTYITLELIRKLKAMRVVKDILLIAPIDVVYRTWPHEIEKFGYDFTTSIIHSGGGNAAAKRLKALEAPADIHMINPKGLMWLSKVGRVKWDLLIVDESTHFKSWSAKQTQALVRMLPDIKKRIILTGTPQPNDVIDLFSQAFILDDGETLGRSRNVFNKRFCKRGGFKGYQWLPTSFAEKEVQEAIAPMCLRLDEVDHLDLPERVDSVQWVTLPEEPMRQYKRMEKELFVYLDEGETLTATNAGAKYQACRSIANGGIYEKEERENGNGNFVKVVKETHQLHYEKVDKLQELHEGIYRKPMLVAYQFNHDRDRILERFPKAPVISGGQRTAAGMKKRQAILDQWDRGKIPLLLVQPQTMYEGANLQAGGSHVCWFGLPTQLNVYLQFNKRLHRQGQKDVVRVYHILAANTVEESSWEVLTKKDLSQQAMLQALKDYWKCRQKNQNLTESKRPFLSF